MLAALFLLFSPTCLVAYLRADNEIVYPARARGGTPSRMAYGNGFYEIRDLRRNDS